MRKHTTKKKKEEKELTKDRNERRVRCEHLVTVVFHVLIRRHQFLEAVENLHCPHRNILGERKKKRIKKHEDVSQIGFGWKNNMRADLQPTWT